MSNRRNKQFAPSYLTGFRGNVNDAAGGVSRAPTAPCRPQPGINIANCAADAVDSSRYRTFTGDNGAKDDHPVLGPAAGRRSDPLKWPPGQRCSLRWDRPRAASEQGCNCSYPGPSPRRIRSWRHRMAEHDLRQSLEVGDDHRTVATAEVITLKHPAARPGCLCRPSPATSPQAAALASSMPCWTFPRSGKARIWKWYSGLATANHCSGSRSAART